jgi:hypothetical protein
MNAKAMQRSDFPSAFNGGFLPAITNCRCPRCKSRDIILTETMEALTSWEVVGGKLNREDGIHEFGSYVGLRGDCKNCSHGWRIRGAIQITDVVTELDPVTLKPL